MPISKDSLDEKSKRNLETGMFQLDDNEYIWIPEILKKLILDINIELYKTYNDGCDVTVVDDHT
jgi:hypothetical protein